MKNSVNKSAFAKEFLTMVKNTFSDEEAKDICMLANKYSDEFLNAHPDAEGDDCCDYRYRRVKKQR